MHQIKVAKIGNSLTLRLTKEVLNHLKVEEGDAVFFTQGPDGSFRITPYNPEFEAQMSAAAAVLKRRRQALHTLAD